jgi:hypothetical protein
LSDDINALIVVTVFREITLHFKINSDATFITFWINLGVFNSGQRIGHYGKAG